MPVAGVEGAGSSAPPPRPVEEDPTQETQAEEPAAEVAEVEGADGVGNHLNVIA